MKTVPMGGKKAAGRVTTVSDEKYDLVMAHRWHLWEERHPDGSIKSGPYPRTNIRLPDGRKTTIKMHQLIMGCPLGRPPGRQRTEQHRSQPAQGDQRAEQPQPWTPTRHLGL